VIDFPTIPLGTKPRSNRDANDDLLEFGAGAVRAAMTAAVSAPGVSLNDFRAYMPMHSYIFVPTGELWPGTSVNSRIRPLVDRGPDGTPRLDDKGKPKILTAANWLDRERPVEQMTWAPGEPKVIEDRLTSEGGWITRPGCSCFNLYRPPVLVTGNPDGAERWLEHVKRVYPDEAAHIIKWLAHRAQRPHEKINHALVLGGAQGIGKDTLLEPVKAAIGPWNFVEVSPQHMLGRFNGFAKSVILRVSEARDLGDVDRFAFYDHLKAYTAAPPDVLRVDEKNLREYAILNVCGVIITTNHKSDGIFLPPDDRRHFVAWSELSRDDFPGGYWSDLWAWYEASGIRDVAAYLRTVDITEFDAKAPPPKTEGFWAIVDSNRAPEDADMADALDKLGNPAATTLVALSGSAAEAFSGWLLDRRNSRKVPHRLEGCGYESVRNPSAKDGLWKFTHGRAVIYAKKGLTVRDRLAAAEALIGNTCPRR
jgi:hypothetical protein